MKLLTPAQAAERLGCTRGHIYALAAEGRLKRYFIGKKGGVLRISDEDVDRFIAEAEAPLSGDAA